MSMLLLLLLHPTCCWLPLVPASLLSQHHAFAATPCRAQHKVPVWLQLAALHTIQATTGAVGSVNGGGHIAHCTSEAQATGIYSGTAGRCSTA
jgi:hypothetical protein